MTTRIDDVDIRFMTVLMATLLTFFMFQIASMGIIGKLNSGCEFTPGECNVENPASLILWPIFFVAFLTTISILGMHRMKALGFPRLAGLIAPVLFACHWPQEYFTYVYWGGIPESDLPEWKFTYSLIMNSSIGDQFTPWWPVPYPGFAAVALLLGTAMAPSIGASSARSRIPVYHQRTIVITFAIMLTSIMAKSITDLNYTRSTAGGFEYPRLVHAASFLIYLGSFIAFVQAIIQSAKLSGIRAEDAFPEPVIDVATISRHFRDIFISVPWRVLFPIAFLAACCVFLVAMDETGASIDRRLVCLLVLLVPAILPTTILYLAPLSTAFMLARRLSVSTATLFMLALLPLALWATNKIEFARPELATEQQRLEIDCKPYKREFSDLPALSPSGWMLKQVIQMPRDCSRPIDLNLSGF